MAIHYSENVFIQQSITTADFQLFSVLSTMVFCFMHLQSLTCVHTKNWWLPHQEIHVCQRLGC